jgi:hypothetical protein
MRRLPLTVGCFVDYVAEAGFPACDGAGNWVLIMLAPRQLTEGWLVRQIML